MIRSKGNEHSAEGHFPDSLVLHTAPPLTLTDDPERRNQVRVGERVRRYLSCLRIEEILFLQGPPFFGAALALGDTSLESLGLLALLTIANVLLMAHVFLLNDWSGLSNDLGDPNRAARVFTVRGVSRDEVERAAAGLLVVSLALFAWLGIDTLCLAAAIAMLSALYSMPRFQWKGKPILNSVAHLTGGILHFLLGYSLGSVIDGRGIAIATFFALTFVAGHLTQEVRDREGDVRNGIRTNAVIFGSRRAFQAGLMVFTLAYGVLVAMAVQKILPLPLAAVGLLYPLHLRWSIQTMNDGLTYASIVTLQRRYRALYTCIALSMVAVLAG